MRNKYTLTLRSRATTQTLDLYTSNRQALKAFTALSFAVASCGYSEMELAIDGTHDSIVVHRVTFRGVQNG